MNPADITYEIVENPGEDPALLVHLDGKPRPLHSRRNPRREADSLVPSLKSAEGGILIVLGLGLGYHLAGLEGMTGAFTDVIIIDILEGIEEHLDTNRGISFIKKDYGPLFLTGCTIPDLKPLLEKRIDLEGSERLTVVEHPASNRLFAPYYGEVKEVIKDIINSKAANRVTREAFGIAYLRNAFKSLGHLEKLHPVRDLFGAMKGKTALVLSSGPGLDETVMRLKTSEHRPFLICVDSALPVLRGRGIDVDCIVSIDPQPHIMEHLNPGRGTAPLVVGTLSGYDRLWPWAAFEGCFLSLNSHPAAQLLDELYPGHIGSIDSVTGTVAGEALMLALKMGFSRVAVTGIDFSFPRYTMYARGSAYQNRYGAFLNSRMAPVETLNSRYIRKSRDAGIELGVATRRSFLQYRRAIGELVGREGGERVVHIRGEGLSLDNASEMTIDQLLHESEEFCEGSQSLPDFTGLSLPLGESLDLRELFQLLKKKEVLQSVLVASLAGSSDARLMREARFIRTMIPGE